MPLRGVSRNVGVCAVALVLTLGGGCAMSRRSHFARADTGDRAAACVADLAACRARCEGGDGATCNLLGVQLELGVLGGARPHAASIEYTRGCNADFAPSCANLGWLVLRGRGVPADPALAMVLFQHAYDSYSHACVMGSGPSCVAAVDLLDMSDVPDADQERLASALLERGCELGQARACADRESL